MKNIPTFESFLNEGNGSFQAFELDDYINDMHNDVLKMQRQAKTQEEKQLLSKLLNEVNRFDAVVGELSAAWETLHEGLAEGMDTKYWAGYNDQNSPQSTPEFAEKTTNLNDTFSDAVEEWNAEAEGAENRIKGAQVTKIKKLAEEFFKKEKWISINVIHAMIAQES